MTQQADLPLITAPLWHSVLYFTQSAPRSNDYVRRYDLKQSFITQQSLNTIFIKSFPQKKTEKGEVHSRGIKTNSSVCFKVTYRSGSSNHTRYSRMFCDTIKAQCCICPSSLSLTLLGTQETAGNNSRRRPMIHQCLWEWHYSTAI